MHEYLVIKFLHPRFKNNIINQADSLFSAGQFRNSICYCLCYVRKFFFFLPLSFASVRAWPYLANFPFRSSWSLKLPSSFVRPFFCLSISLATPPKLTCASAPDRGKSSLRCVCECVRVLSLSLSLSLSSLSLSLFL